MAGAQVTSVAFVEAERMLVTGDNAGVIKVWLFGMYDYAGQHSGHDGAVAALTVVPGRGKSPESGEPREKSLVVSGGEDGALMVWEVTPPGWVRGRSMPFANAAPRGTMRYHRGPVTALLTVPLSKHVLSAGVDGTLCVWDARRGVCLRTTSRKDEILCAALRFDASEVLAGTRSGEEMGAGGNEME